MTQPGRNLELQVTHATHLTPAHIRTVWLGRVPYREAWEIQRRVHACVVDGGESVLLLCEHAPVYTLGSRSDAGHLLRSDAEYAELGAEVVQADRGGDVTFHGPGQLVGYPIFRLEDMPCGRDLHGFLRLLEAALIDAASALGVRAFTVAGKTGVWTGEGKIAAMGLRCARWVSMHGFAFNVDTDLRWFSHIVPCGLAEPVTSLRASGSGVNMAQAREACVAAICARFEVLAVEGMVPTV